MPQRNPHRLSCLSIALGVMLSWASAMHCPTVAVAQVRIPAAALQQDGQVTELLRQGTEFEQNGRWGEALSHYEHSLREHPGNRDLLHRRRLTRIHYDLARRYADGSFLTSVSQLRSEEALAQYGDVLQKINTHYVETPNWRQMVTNGVDHLAAALNEASFVSVHRIAIDSVRNEGFLSEVHRMLNSIQIRTPEEAQAAVGRVADLASQRLGLSATAVVLEYTSAAVTLDTYSSYLTGGQLEDIYAQIEGNFVGLGVELRTEQDAILIVEIIPNSPAEAAGLVAGDRITSVDGAHVSEITADVAADRLKGEEGSDVLVGVIGTNGAIRQLRVRRERVEVPSVVETQLLDNELGIAYLKINSFQKNTNRDLDAALWQLHRQGMRSLVIDLRGNPGGLLTASVEIADKFITEGTIVSTRGRSSREDFDYRAHQAGTWRVPLVVLIDGDSASASEIFAGAIHDHRRGTIVGVRSYGKGSVQGIFPLLVGGAGVRLTTARFYSPSGQAISNQGVEPDVIVRTTARVDADGWVAVDAQQQQRDAILEAGLQVARQHLTQLP